MADDRHHPSYEGTWTDDQGGAWQRKGPRLRVLDARRVRTLLRREDVPLVVWQAFETVRYDDVAAKQAAHHELSSVPDDDLRASEWTSADGRLLLLLERFC